MKLACMTFSVGPGSLAETLETIRRLGLECIDLATGSLGQQQVDRLKAATEPREQAAWVRKELVKFGMDVSEVFVLNFGDPINHPDLASRERTRELFEGIATFSREIGAESIMMIPGPVHEEIGAEESFRLSVEELRALRDMSAAQGLQLNIEPHYPSLAQSPDGTIRLCEAVPGLKLTLDYSHFVAQGYDQGAVEPLHAYASHFHARQAKQGNRNAPRAEGTIDFHRLVNKLQADRWEGTICLEYEPHDLDAYAESLWLKEDLERFMAES